jgi:hypothetical protein
MARIPVDIIPSTVLTTLAATYYTTPLGKTTIIKKVSFTNVTTDIIKITLYKVARGGSPGVTNIIANQKALDALETWSCPDIEGKTLEEGASLRALSDIANSVNIDGSGTEVV